MANYFLKNTIFTDYALNKLNNCMILNTLDFNFSKVVISNEFSPLDVHTKHLANEIYDLPIDKVEMTDNNIFTIYSAIDENIYGIKIWQLGLYERVNGEDILFAYGNVDTSKPITDFDLIINLEINLETAQMVKDLPEIEIIKPTPASKEEGFQLGYHFLDVSNILEPIIRANHDTMVAQPLDSSFTKLRNTHDILEITCRTMKYCDLLKIASSLEDSFLYYDTNYLSYTVNNLNRENSYLTYSNGIFISTNDNTLFTTNGGTLLILAKLQKVPGIILNKTDSNNFNFTFEIDNNYDLVFRIYESFENYLQFKVTVDSWNILSLDYFPIIITYDGTETIKMYINGNEVSGTLTNNNFHAPCVVSDMNLSNSISDFSTFNEALSVHDIYFFSEELNAEEIKALGCINNFVV